MSHHLPGSSPPPENHATKARQMAGQLAQSAGQAVQSWTVRRYTLPDKSVASQVLMYRQLLHTKCRPGLKLSRDYQGTPAQVAVKDMPWWEKGMQETKKMVISYDGLIHRLWLHGAIYPYQVQDTLLDEEGQPPIPHDYWVHHVGFQQPDPVTDFRSGGVLSLAMMVHLVESCDTVHERFVHGDAAVLPFGITSINITDMMAKFLMLAKNVDRMDALLSQKPFWKMFADPYALLACQELSMDMLADVVVELRQERQVFSNQDVTVFDFSFILEKTERRVQYDLLGAGPQNVEQLRAIHKRLKVKYQTQLEAKLARMKGDDGDNDEPTAAQSAPTSARESVLQQASGFGVAASSFAGSVFSKIKAPGFTSLKKPESTEPTTSTTPVTDSVLSKVATAGGAADLISGSPPKPPSPTIAEIPNEPPVVANDSKPAANPTTEMDSDGDWAGTDIEPVTDAVSNFSIHGDEDDEEGL